MANNLMSLPKRGKRINKGLKNAKSLHVQKKKVILKKKVKLKKITVVPKKITVTKKVAVSPKKAVPKKITVLKKSKEGQRSGGNKSLLKKEAEKKEAEQKKKRHYKTEKHYRTEMSPVQSVSGDTIVVPIATTIGHVEEKETQHVSGELYDSMFAFSIESPIQVDSQLWDSIKENLPDNYMIPDPEFIEAVLIDDLPKEITSAMTPGLLKPIAVPIEISLSEPESEPDLTKADGSENKG